MNPKIYASFGHPSGFGPPGLSTTTVLSPPQARLVGLVEFKILLKTNQWPSARCKLSSTLQQGFGCHLVVMHVTNHCITAQRHIWPAAMRNVSDAGKLRHREAAEWSVNRGSVPSFLVLTASLGWLTSITLFLGAHSLPRGQNFYCYPPSSPRFVCSHYLYSKYESKNICLVWVPIWLRATWVVHHYYLCLGLGQLDWVAFLS